MGSGYDMSVHGKPRLRQSLEPIPSVEAAQQAANQIREAIISGVYRPGARLIERELTEQLNVSRHPVREALRLLAREGFVNLHRNRGAQVSIVDASHVTEVYAIRMSLGNLALDRLIGGRGLMTTADLKRLEMLKEKALRFARLHRHDDTVEVDLEFQQSIIDASLLPRVQRYFIELTDDVRRFDRTLSIVYTDQESYVQKYIVGLYSAISDNSLERARAIWQGKFEKAVGRFLAAIAGTDLDGAKRVVGNPSAGRDRYTGGRAA